MFLGYFLRLPQLTNIPLMKNLTLIALLLISTISVAQSKFIEVEVTDTITLKPLSYRCNLNVDTYNYDIVVEATNGSDDDAAADVYQEYDAQAAEENGKKKIEELKKMLEAKKFKVSPLDDSYQGAIERRSYDKEGFTVIVNSMAELQSLQEVLAPRQDVTVAVSVLKYEDEQKAEEVLIKRLISKAKARAAVIGANSGLKPGRILEVKEGKPGKDSSLVELYSQILKMGSYRQGLATDTGSLSKTFVIKFIAE